MIDYDRTYGYKPYLVDENSKNRFQKCSKLDKLYVLYILYKLLLLNVNAGEFDNLFFAHCKIKCTQGINLCS